MFRSIQTAFAALAGASILAVIGALLVYVLVSGARTQDMVASNTRTLIEDMVEQRVTNLARYQASQIRAQLQTPLLVTTELARVHRLTGMVDAEGMPMANLTREELINLGRATLIDNPVLTSMYFAWEPNAIDANDIMYKRGVPRRCLAWRW